MSTGSSPTGDLQVTKGEPKTIEEALRLLQQNAKANGTDKLTMEEIIEEIAAYRREQELTAK